ncbi:MAG: RDD family protein [Verrucomicrobiae bacterium]|nr:RDD family protein [Verrucomicrobiae bacterium]
MALGRTTTLDIRTPDGITFSMPLAGPITRFFAWVIDFLIFIAVSRAIGLLAVFGSIVSTDLAFAVQLLLDLVIGVGYSMFLEWIWNGQTVGKRVMKLRVVDEGGRGLSGGQVVVRNLLRAIDMLPLFYGVGGMFHVLTARCQRLGDLAAGTIVVRRIDVGSPDVDELLAGKFNSFRDHPVIEARLRQRVSPEEAKICLSALLRRNELEPDTRLDVYRRLADHFRSLVEFPESATFGLTDEQYLRNTAESLFRKRPTGKLAKRKAMPEAVASAEA